MKFVQLVVVVVQSSALQSIRAKRRIENLQKRLFREQIYIYDRLIINNFSTHLWLNQRKEVMLFALALLLLLLR